MAFITYEHSPGLAARARDILVIAIHCCGQAIKWALIVGVLPFLIVLGAIVALLQPDAIERN